MLTGFTSACEPITLTDAAKRHRIAKGSLRALTDAGKVRYHDRRRHGIAERITFDPEQLAADLDALPRCQAPRCDAPGTGPSGYCGEHFSQGGRQGARQAEQDLLADLDERDWYTTTEAAKAAPCAPSTINAAIIAGEIASEKTGRIRRIPKAELHRWAEGLPADRTVGRRPVSAGAREWRRERIKRDLANGTSPTAIARQLGLSKHTVYREIRALELDGVIRSSRPLTPAAIRRAAELYAEEGQTLRTIAVKFGCSVGQIRDQLERLGVRRRPAYKLSEYPQPSERACEQCGALFLPRHPAADPRFHSAECADRWRVEQVELALKDRDLRSVSETAQEIGLSDARVYGLINAELLRSELVSVPGIARTVHGIAATEIRRYLRKRNDGDGRSSVWLKGDHVIAHADAVHRTERLMEKGNTRDEAHDLIRMQVERRRRALARHRSGRKPSAVHVRWLERYEHHLAALIELEPERAERLAALQRKRSSLASPDLEDVHDRVDRLDLKVPITTRALDLTVEEDWKLHPEDWSPDAYPPNRWGDLDRRGLPPARDRVRKGLLKARRERLKG